MHLVKVAPVAEIRNHRASSLRVAIVEREQIVSSPMKQIPNSRQMPPILADLEVASGLVSEEQRMYLEHSAVHGGSHKNAYYIVL